MTPDELRSLADEATPGPWRSEQTRWAPHDNRWSYSGPELLDHDGSTSEADARLIALAPDLARLCAELGEELVLAIADLQTLLESDALTRAGRKKLIVSMKRYRAALAKLSELKSAT